MASTTASRGWGWRQISIITLFFCFVKKCSILGFVIGLNGVSITLSDLSSTMLLRAICSMTKSSENFSALRRESFYQFICTEVLSRCLQRELTPNQSPAANDSRQTMKTTLTTICNSQRFLKKKMLNNSNVKVSIKNKKCHGATERIVGEIVENVLDSRQHSTATLSVKKKVCICVG